METADYIELNGTPCPWTELHLQKAMVLVKLLRRDPRYPFAELVECRTLEGGERIEVVTFDVEVTVGQRTVHDIRPTERIAALFTEGDRIAPEALAVRRSFPRVPHLNLRPRGYPKSLCLTDQDYAEVRLHWTATSFVESIRTWLARTADGTLHQDDQPLEPLLGGAEERIVLPSDLFAGDANPVPLFCAVVAWPGSESGRPVIIASREKNEVGGGQEFRAIPFSLPEPLTHGVIHYQPDTLWDLADLLSEARYDFLGELRTRLKGWTADIELLKARPILVLEVQMRRSEDAAPETTATWAFLVDRSLGAVGEAIGALGKSDGFWGPLFQPDEGKRGEDVGLRLLLPYLRMNRERAAAFSGVVDPFSGPVVGIGFGALGSQVFDNLVRGGFGAWTCVDSDLLLPHNLVRHRSYASGVGFPKVLPLAAEANAMFDGPPVASWVVADVLSPGAQAEALTRALVGAEIVLDMSASVAVGRHLARDVDEARGRRVSLFMAPAGTDLVALAEDPARRYRLDSLEMQYYRAVASDPQLDGHLRMEDGRGRYGRSCRDTSAVLSQELVGLHAAIGSRAVRLAQRDHGATIRVWRASYPELEVRLVELDPAPPVEEPVDGWTVSTDEWVLYQLRRFRRSRLPAETGGVLVGSIDMDRRIVYVVDVLPSPPDSIELRTAYIRGYEGLREAVARIDGATAGRLHYVGEWHSHPPGYGPEMSDHDEKLLEWVRGEMAAEARPALVLIMAEAAHRWYLAEAGGTVSART